MDIVQAIGMQGVMEVQEFTAVLDDRYFPSTVGFFLEINGDAMSRVINIFCMGGAHVF